MKDLWKELAARVRAEEQVQEAAEPFGFADAALRKVQAVGREPYNRLDDWIAVLKPALGLAFGTALLCLLLQSQVERETPEDAITQTETLIQLAVLE